MMNYVVEHWVGHVGDVVSFLVGIELTMSCWGDMVALVGAGFVKRMLARKILTVVCFVTLPVAGGVCRF